MRMLDQLAVLSALRSRPYRIYWLGMVVSVTGFQMLMVVQGYLVYEISGSPFYLGLVGLFQAVPAIALSLLGGALADRLDRKMLIVTCQILSFVLVFVLAFLTVTGVLQVWHILVIAFALGAVQAFDMPARQALLPHLIAREDLMNAVALQSAVWQGTRIVGPAIGGLLYGPLGPGFCFFVASGGFAVMAFAMLGIRVVVPPADSKGGIFAQIKEGIGFIGQSAIFSTLIGMTFFNSVFGMSFRFLMPIFAKDVLGRGPEALGVLMGAAGLGALFGTFVIASMGDRFNRGWLLLTGAILFGCSLIGFALSTWYTLSVVLMLVGNCFNSLYMVSVQTLLQSMVPDQLRGRVMGVYGLTWSLMPLGGTQGGIIASLVSAPFAVGFGGFAVAAFALVVGLCNSQIRNLGRGDAGGHKSIGD